MAVGEQRLKRMVRRTGKGEEDGTELTAILRQGDRTYRLYLPLSSEGVDEARLRSQEDYEQMHFVWEQLQKQVCVSYDASRNISEYNDTRYSELNEMVQRQMTLFDPLTQISSINVLLKGGEQAAPVLQTLYQLLREVLDTDILRVEKPNPANRLYFRQGDASIETIDLPDGFRATVAWLADLCATWHKIALHAAQQTDPKHISGIVLLDEIDLHLHPSLQRVLVPRLRKVLPNVQFIVTTHSPMVLASFDRAELVVLDQDHQGAPRPLDRQVFGMSIDDVIEWLMDTPSESKVIEEIMAEGTDADRALYLYQSKEANEERARRLLEERRSLLEELRDESS